MSAAASMRKHSKVPNGERAQETADRLKLLECSCLRRIKVLSFVILTLIMIFVFENKTWSSVVVEEMDGSCLEYVPLME